MTDTLGGLQQEVVEVNSLVEGGRLGVGCTSVLTVCGFCEGCW